jgi:hypothetical protein
MAEVVIGRSFGVSMLDDLHRPLIEAVQYLGNAAIVDQQIAREVLVGWLFLLFFRLKKNEENIRI